MSTSYGAGLAFGIVTALIIFALVWKFSKRSMKGTFDERQELVRGRGYKYACFTMLGLLVLDLLIESLDAFETLPVTRSLAIFIMILAGVMVYALYCIKNDSYFGVGTDTRTYRAVMWIVIVCNAISGFSGLTVSEGSAINLNGHKLYVDGKEYSAGSSSTGEAFDISTGSGSGSGAPDGNGGPGGNPPSGEPPEKPDNN